MDTAGRVRKILSARGLTLYSVSRQSAEIFGRSSSFRIPHNLYSRLANPSLKPTIHQVLALSHITDYRLADWLKVFGIDLDSIFQLQLRIPRRGTTLLDPTVHDTSAWIPWFAERLETGRTGSIAPLGRFLSPGPPKRAGDLLALGKQRFLYAVVGEEDLYALPYFVPGSIVRADPRGTEETSRRKTNKDAGFFLVEHRSGWTCSRVILLGNDRVLLHCPQRPCAERELFIGRDARILGAIDAELRPLIPQRPKQFLPAPTISRKLHPRYQPQEQRGFRGLLGCSRMKAGISFREASSISRLIADALSDELYFTAIGTLSDYETLAAPPRHIQKIITLCLLYCIGFDEFLLVSELPLDKAGREPIPDELIGRQRPNGNRSLQVSGQDSVREPRGFLAALLHQWKEVPLLLRFSLDEITGLSGFSLSDVFWVGDGKANLHPLLSNGTLVAVNRRARKPALATQDAVCERQLNLILKRDGSYLCGFCTLDEGNLALHGYPGGPIGTQQFKNGIDAEVVGQVTAILRRLG